MSKNYVAYMRVSTQKQKNSGLGLEGQKAIIEHFSKIQKAEIVKEFVEAESGKEAVNRPILNEAVRYCKENDCILIVSKIDRLSRNVKDTFAIVEALEGKVMACDIPNYPIDSLTLAIFAGLAQRERELISLRTKAALKAKRDRGEVIVRKPSVDFHLYRQRGQQAVKEYTKDFYTDEILVSLLEKYIRLEYTYEKIADELNKRLFRTRRGQLYNKLSVLRLINNVKKYYLRK